MLKTSVARMANHDALFDYAVNWAFGQAKGRIIGLVTAVTFSRIMGSVAVEPLFLVGFSRSPSVLCHSG